MPLLLTDSDVRAVLDLDELRQAMERVLASYSAGRATQPLRTVIEAGSPSAFAGVPSAAAALGWLGVMPAFLPALPALGAKLVTVFGGNSTRGLPTHLATILLWDTSTGQLVAIMDGRYITETRTAAVSAVSAQWLGPAGCRVQHAAPSTPPRPLTLAIIGSGVQARSHFEALGRIAHLTDVRVWSPTQQHRARFADEMRGEIAIRAVDTAEHAVRGADLIVLATSAREPVVDNRWVAGGAHIMAVGACRPDQREMDPSLIARGRVFVDSRAGAFSEAGDIVLALAEGRITRVHVVGELGEVVAGRVAGRTAEAEVTIFKSLGMAVEDVVAADLVYRRARKGASGTFLPL